MNNCRYIITTERGEFSIPSSLLSEDIASLDDFKKNLLNWLESEASEDEIKDLKNQLTEMDKNLVIPELIKGVVIGQTSIKKLYFKDFGLRNNLSHLKNTLKDIQNLTKENVLECALPDDITYTYLPENDLILINNNQMVDKSNILRAILERSVYLHLKEVGREGDPKKLLMSQDSEILGFLKIPSVNFSKSDLNYLYFDESSMSDINILENLNKNSESWKDIKEKFSKLSLDTVRNQNYAPVNKTNIYELSPGDLILEPNNYYGLFVDYYVDGKGNYIVRTISKDSNFPKKVTYFNEVVSARKYFPDEKFDNYDIDPKSTYLEVELPINAYDEESYLKNRMLTKVLKRGDKIIISKKSTGRGRPSSPKEYIVQNFKGSTLIVSDGIETINIDKLDTIHSIKLNKQNHSDLMYARQFIEKYSTESLNKDDKDLIKELDIVGYDTQEGVKEGIVIAVLDNLFIVKDLDTDTLVRVPKFDVKSLKVNNFGDEQIIKALEYFVNNSTPENVTNPVELVKLVKDLKVNYIKTSLNVIDYYDSFFLQRGDIIVKDDNSYIITSSRGRLVRVFDGSNYSYLNKSELTGSSIVTSRNQDQLLSDKSIKKNSFFISNDPYKLPKAHSVEVEVFQNSDKNKFKGNLFISKSDPNYEKYKGSDYINVTSKYKSDNGFNQEDSLYAFRSKENDGVFVRNSEYLSAINVIDSGINDIFDYISPGSFVKGSDLKYWLVERKIKDSLIVSYSYYSNGKVNTIKKVIPRTSSEVKYLYIPHYAKYNLSQINQTLFGGNDQILKESRDINYINEYDSPELIASMSMLLEDKYGIKINFIHESELEQFGQKSGVRAFLLNGNYYVNIDKASVSDPLHEFLHMILADMKYSDRNNYVTLISSVKNHELFTKVAESYKEINLDVLEETFIRLFTDTLRSKITVDKIFTEDNFDLSVKLSIQELLSLNNSIKDESLYDIFDTQLKDVLVNFGSTLINNDKPLYNTDNALQMIAVSNTLKELIKENKLKEACNG